LKKQNDYALSVVKLSLPAQAIDSFRALNTDDYRVKLSTYFDWTLAIPPIATLADEREASNSLFLTSEYPYKNYEDVIESVNRTILKTFRDQLYLWIDGFYSGNRVVATDNFAFNIAVAPFTYSKVINIAKPQHSTGRLGYIKVSVNSGNVADPVQSHSLTLTSPSGVKVTLYKNRNTKTGNVMVFEDGCMTSLSSLPDPKLPIPAGTYQPLETFLSFNSGLDETGNWTFEWTSTGMFLENNLIGFAESGSVTIDASFIVNSYSNGNDMEMMQIPPVLRETNGKLELLLHQTYYTSNTSLAFSPKLYAMLGFNGVKDSGGYYRIKTPQIVLDNPITKNSYITFQQPVSTLYKLTPIRAILIKSNSIGVDGEYDNIQQESIVMSIDTSTITLKDRYEFSQTIDRYYDLISDSDLYTINFSVWVEYDDGSVVMAKLPAYSDFNLLIKFVRKSIIRS
jgi:hypothetical protein